MKLLIISTDRKIFEEGSAVRVRVFEYAKDWGEVHIIVFTKKNMRFTEICIAPNCWVYPTNSFSQWFYVFGAMKLGRFILERRNITNITCQDPFLTAMSGISLKRQYDIPLEINLHTDIGSPNYAKTIGNKIRKSLALSYLPKADSIRVVSSRIRDYLVKTVGIDQSKISIRPITVDVEWIKNAPVIESADLHEKYPQFEKIILMASRLEKEKNIELAIRAFAEVLKKLPKTGLVIVGEGREETKLKKLSARLGIENSVIFGSWANKETIASYYKTADIFLNTSLYEGYGMTLVEAQATGCKIISTDVGIAKEVGVMIVGYNVTEIANMIISCLIPMSDIVTGITYEITDNNPKSR